MMNEVRDYLDGYIVAEELAGSESYRYMVTPKCLFVTRDSNIYISVEFGERVIYISSIYRKLSSYMKRRYATEKIIVDTEQKAISVIKHLLGVEFDG